MKFFFPALLLVLLAATACEIENEFLTGNEVRLRYSTDTVAFDTVFAARGSATRIMKIYNDANEAVMIDRITVEGRTGVDYLFNVDGQRGPEVRDAVIFGNDSIFVFIEVEVDPTAPPTASPYIAEDRLLVETGDNQDQIVLLAFGQNANYLNGFNRGRFFGISCDNATAVLPDDLPIVIYGSLIIDSCVVQARAGTQIFFHGGVQRNVDVGGFFNDGLVFVGPDGSLQLLGERDNPVVLRTDRLEPEFTDDAAKYRGLIFGAGSRGNVLRFTELYNAIVGVQADSLAEVTISNSIIAFSGGPAVAGYQSDVTVRNSLFHDNFGDAVRMVKGGRLSMDHVTVANYGVDASALTLTNFACDENNANCLAAPLVAEIRNSVLAGSRGSELVLADIFEGTEPETFALTIDNSVVRTDGRFLQQLAIPVPGDRFYEDLCRNCFNLDFDDPLFLSQAEDDYRLDSLSVAQGLGRFLPGVPTDLLGNERDRQTPDAGAYERPE